MPNVQIEKELFDRLSRETTDTTRRVNEIVLRYLNSPENFETANIVGDTRYRHYFEHGNAD
ncbi:MAG: hypothetical protein M1476_05480 [Candidatus Thermoplasmatota archaeon]|nr:hypothetical protein [Candidatus Thermoplasmatota archaeon]